MSRTTTVLLYCAIPFLATTLMADRAKGPGSPWGTIEKGMRRAGCFVPPIATLRDALRSKDSLCRGRAARALGLRGDKDVIPDLKAIQEHDPDPRTKRQAAFALVRLAERDYLVVLQREMEQQSSLKEKVSLAGELAAVGDPSGLRHLEDACRSPSLQDRASCTWEIGKFYSVAKQDAVARRVLFDLLIALTEDSEANLRRDGLMYLGSWGLGMVLPQPVVAKLEALAATSPDQETRRQASMALAQQEERKRGPNRLFEIYRLGSAGDKGAIPALKAIYDGDPDPQARRTAALALIRLGERSYLEPLRKIMEENQDDDLFLEGELARLGDWSGYPHVAEACRSTNAKRRKSCAGVLHHFTPLAKQTEDFLVTFMDQALDLVGDSDPQVRSLATAELAIHCRALKLTPDMVTRLESLAASSPYSEVREMARAAFEEQKWRKLNPTKQEP